MKVTDCIAWYNRRQLKANRRRTFGEPYAGKPHVRFDEGRRWPEMGTDNCGRLNPNPPPARLLYFGFFGPFQGFAALRPGLYYRRAVGASVKTADGVVEDPKLTKIAHCSHPFLIAGAER